ncbi:MAG: glycosyltransferase family 2 protein [Planctomycetota bacterium]
MRISVIVPTFNAGAQITALLDAMRAQHPAPPHEIVVIDSGSKDDTQQRVLAGGGRFVPLNAKFNHGLARDAGIAASTGELVFVTVQDAVPAAPNCLARFAKHFDDPNVAGVSSRQIPPPDGPAELKIKAELDLRVNDPITRVSLVDHPNYAEYSPEECVELYRFDNVGAMLRRSVWEQIPYGACDYAEDMLWAKHALEAGHTLVRDFTAPLIHAHRRSFAYEFRRGVLDARVMDELFGFRYRLIKKINRVAMLARPSASGARKEAFKTYSAHALARMVYGTYASVLKPLGLGAGMMERLTKGI